LVQEGGTANLGIHLHNFDEDKLKQVLDTFWKSLQPKEIPNNVPRSGVAKFIGREPELEQLHGQLQQGNLVSISAVEGMGGVGKTELAIHIMSGRLTMIKLLPPPTNRNESNH
jgi:hypothetical protein